nr:MAG TPA: hypothetical protein [Caudoviricetes sp.]
MPICAGSRVVVLGCRRGVFFAECDAEFTELFFREAGEKRDCFCHHHIPVVHEASLCPFPRRAPAIVYGYNFTLFRGRFQGFLKTGKTFFGLYKSCIGETL